MSARDTGEPRDNRRPGFHLARAKAFLILGDKDKAQAEFHAALAHDADMVEAHVGLAELRLPGEGYQSWLQRFHELLKPEFYLEIGVAEGHTLTLAQPPTRVIGIDPNPKITSPMRAETHIFRETSDEFFSKSHLTSLLGQRPLSLAFIDGAHVFAQSLRDFMNVERFCGGRSLVLFHDTIPLDEITQRPDRQRKFYTGDVWKTILCLKHYRPDLDIFTIATPSSGLTVLTGLNPDSCILAACYEEAVDRFIELPYIELQGREHEMLNVVPNERDTVAERLKRRGVLQ